MQPDMILAQNGGLLKECQILPMEVNQRQKIGSHFLYKEPWGRQVINVYYYSSIIFIYLFIKTSPLTTSGRVTTTVYTNYYGPFKNCILKIWMIFGEKNELKVYVNQQGFLSRTGFFTVRHNFRHDLLLLTLQSNDWW